MLAEDYEGDAGGEGGGGEVGCYCYYWLGDVSLALELEERIGVRGREVIKWEEGREGEVPFASHIHDQYP